MSDDSSLFKNKNFIMCLVNIALTTLCCIVTAIVMNQGSTRLAVVFALIACVFCLFAAMFLKKCPRSYSADNNSDSNNSANNNEKYTAGYENSQNSNEDYDRSNNDNC